MPEPILTQQSHSAFGDPLCHTHKCKTPQETFQSAQFPPIPATDHEFHFCGNTDAQGALLLGFLQVSEPSTKAAQCINENIRIKHGQAIHSDAIYVPMQRYLACLRDPSTYQ